MITRQPNETRLAYLLRVAIAHINEHAFDCITEYDGTECDGSCLADELQSELEMLTAPSSAAEFMAEHMPDDPLPEICPKQPQYEILKEGALPLRETSSNNRPANG